MTTNSAFARADKRSLILVSDLLENSAIANMYRPGYSFPDVERRGFKAVRELKGRLAGADVLIHHRCQFSVLEGGCTTAGQPGTCKPCAELAGHWVPLV